MEGGGIPVLTDVLNQSTSVSMATSKARLKQMLANILIISIYLHEDFARIWKTSPEFLIPHSCDQINECQHSKVINVADILMFVSEDINLISP